MKVEDYFQNYNIRDQEQKCNSIQRYCAVTKLGHGCRLSQNIQRYLIQKKLLRRLHEGQDHEMPCF